VAPAEQKHDLRRPRAGRRLRRQLLQSAQRHQGRRAGPGALQAGDQGLDLGAIRSGDLRVFRQRLAGGGLRLEMLRRPCDGAARRARTRRRHRLVLDGGERRRRADLHRGVHLSGQARVRV